MKRRLRVNIILILICVIFATAVHSQDYQLVTDKITDNVLMITTKTGNSTMMAVAGEKGILVVDAMWSPRIARQAKKVITKELGRDDFKYLVLANFSDLSCGGISAFSECEIIAHEKTKQALEQFIANKSRSLAGRAREFLGRVERTNSMLENIEKGSEREKGLKNWVELCEIIAADMEKGYEVPLPSRVINSEESIDLGGQKVILMPFGDATSGGDLLVLLPSEKTLFLGDIFHALHVMPLQDPGVKAEPGKWLESLERITSKEGEYTRFIRANGELIWDATYLNSRKQLLEDMLNFAKRASNEKKNLTELLTLADDLEKNFPYLKDWSGYKKFSGIIKSDIRNTLTNIWKNEHKSAAVELEAVLLASGIEEAEKLHRTIRKNNSNEFYFLENEFNAAGYNLMRQNKVAEATTLFKITVEEFPSSWNAWDSLGEVYLWREDYINARKAYGKSLELNPQSPSGAAAMGRMEGIFWDIEHETKIPPKYQPGEQTNLKGPYLGQETPGIKPELFAPGIVSTNAGKEFSGCFSPDGKEFYFNRDGKIMFSYLKEQGWTAPAVASFNSESFDHEAHITADNKTMYFGSGRPREGGGYGIYRMLRTEDGWSKPEFLFDGMYVTSTANGEIYLTDFQRNGTARYTLDDGRIVTAERQEGGVNSPATASHACISKDESFIIIDSTRPGGQGGEGDFYICFKQEDGTWGEGINLGDEINSKGANICPFLSPDEKYLFFYKERDMYWVSTEIFKNLE